MWTIKHKNRKGGDTVNLYSSKEAVNVGVNRLHEEGRLSEFEVFELVPVSIQDIPTTVIKKGIV